MKPAYCPLVLFVCALAAGICFDRVHPLPATTWLLAAVIALTHWLGLWITRRERTASWVLLASVLLAGGAWHHAYWRLYRPDDIQLMLTEDSRPVCVEAIALTSPRWIPAPPADPLRTIPIEERSELAVRLTAIRDCQRFRPASGKATLQVGGLLTGIHAGDRVRVVGHAAQPRETLNPGEFDFAAFERSRRVSGRVFAEFPASVTLLARGSVWSPRRWLADLRSGGSAILWRYIAPERAALASAVLLGTREQLDPLRNEGYLVTGTIHVLSISGLHVGILAAVFFMLLRTGMVPRRATIVATIGLTLVYAALVDFEAPVMRATILVTVACLALWTGRSAIGFNALAAAGLAVLAFNPSSLFLAGPQLSFMAVATMIAFRSWLTPQRIADPLDRLIAASRPWWTQGIRYVGGFLWRVWLAGALIWLVSTPLVWQQYHLISPIALVLNFLMWIPVSLAMYLGFGTLVAGSMVPQVGPMFGQGCDHCLALLEQIIEAGRNVPGGYGWLAAPPGWWIAVFYVVTGVVLAFPALRPPRYWLLTCSILWIAGALTLSGQGVARVTRWQPRPLACHFIAVGHGIAALVELPDGRNLLYDAGHLGVPRAGVQAVSAMLWSRGISHLDAVVISHADADHYNALPGLLERFSVGAIYVSPVMFDKRPPAVELLRSSIAAAGVPLREIYAGQRLAAGDDVKLEILHPPQRGVLGSDNANSIVLKIEHAGRRVLLTGDLESPGLEDVLAEEPLDCDVILAPHHGSPRSNPGGFAEWSTPEFVVISGSRGLADLPAMENVKHSFRLRGAEVFHTAEDGCLRVEINGETIAVTSHRPHVRGTAASANGNLLQAE